MKKIIDARIIKNEEIALDIFDMMLYVGDMVQDAKSGNFVMLYPNSKKNILPRPISICEIDKNKKTFRLIYQKIGEGTTLFSELKENDNIKMLGVCGNGYNIPKEKSHHILIGGGIGVPPLLETCKNLDGEKTVVLGFRDEIFLKNEFESLGARVYIATDSGKKGFKGNVIELMKKENIKGEYIYACGPTPMLKAVSEYAEKNNIKAQVSLEERMACGIGACVCCVAKIIENDEPIFKKVCKDGPVFDAKEVFYK